MNWINAKNAWEDEVRSRLQEPTFYAEEFRLNAVLQTQDKTFATFAKDFALFAFQMLL